MTFQKSSVNLSLAYILWGLGFFGLCGLHRFYLGKPVSAIIWFLTFGGFFIGQIVDLFLIPSMVQERNHYLSGSMNMGKAVLQGDAHPMQKLLKAAKDNGNVLSLGQAILMTNLPPNEVKELLKDALRQGLAEIDNEPNSGAVRYHFDL
jgi:TM2 domain-containing membrane protein YozV